MATKSKKKTEPVLPAPADFDDLHSTLEKIARQLDAVDLSESKSRSAPKEKPKRVPGRFKGALVVGGSFFEPLTDDELKEFSGE